MNNPLYLFVGRSASGKTTVANILESVGKYSQLQSYTTRPRRTDDEVGHIFISEEEFDKLENIIGYTEYNDHRYCSTIEQIDESSIYIIDTRGVETLLERYQNDRPIVVVYFDTNIRTRIDRMVDRHDCDAAIVSRIYNDEEFDWEQELNKIVWHYKNNVGRNVEMCVVDANKNLENVLAQVTSIVNSSTEESA